jgi:hypothetical protein
VEQLDALCGERIRKNSDRYDARRQRESKPAPLKPKGAAPPPKKKIKTNCADSAALVSAPPVHFWQRRFYDFNVWSEKKPKEKPKEKLKENLEYMHANPVQRKLVQHPKDWPWSSWTHYAGKGKGRIRMDSIQGDRESQNPHP